MAHRLTQQDLEGGRRRARAGHGREGRERGMGKGGGPRASEEGSGGRRRRRRRDGTWAGGEGGGGNRNGVNATGRSLPTTAGPRSLPRSRTPAAPRPSDTLARPPAPLASAPVPSAPVLCPPTRVTPVLTYPLIRGRGRPLKSPSAYLFGREGPPQVLRKGVPGPGGRGAAGVLKVVPA